MGVRTWAEMVPLRPLAGQNSLAVREHEKVPIFLLGHSHGREHWFFGQ